MRCLSAKMLTAASAYDLAGERIPRGGRFLDIAFFGVLGYAALCQLIGAGVYDRVVRSFDIVLREFAVIANQPLCQVVGDILLLGCNRAFYIRNAVIFLF